MSNVTVPFGDDPRETSILLLGAAEDLELGRRVVRTDGAGNFLAPREVADKAGVEYESDDDEESEPAPAKKAAKKSAKKSSK